MGIGLLLRAVPLWAWALVAALAWGGLQHRRASVAGSELLRVQGEIATAREQAMHGALVETSRRLSAQQEVADAAQTAARRARADAVSAGAAAGKLRTHAASLAASAGACDPAATVDGAAAGGAGVVLADMLGRVTAHAGELASEADKRGAAGAECAGRYGALKAP